VKHQKHSVGVAAFAMFVAPIVVLISGSAYAEKVDYSNLSAEQVRSVLAVKIRTVQHMALNPVLVNAVKDQNSEKLKAVTVKRRGEAWKKSVLTDPFKQNLQKNDAGQFLENKIKDRGEFSAGLLTDNQGANVANFPSARSYNHSKEESWRASWATGKGAVFLSRPTLNKRSGMHTVKISTPVRDRGVAIGVLTIDVSLDDFNTTTNPDKQVSDKKIDEKSIDTATEKSEVVVETPVESDGSAAPSSEAVVGENSTESTVTEEVVSEESVTEEKVMNENVTDVKTGVSDTGNVEK